MRLKQIIESNSEEIKLTQSELDELEMDELEKLTGTPEDNMFLKHLLNLPSRHEHLFN